MTSIIRRTAVLGFARLTRQAISFLSPIFMVRLLTIEQYGEYRDFLLYGTLLFFVVGFSINSSLAYFVPKEPARERLYFTQASVFVLGTSTVGVMLLLLFGSYFPSETARSYLYALCLYVFFYSNLDAWEIFWIAKKQTVNVLYYSLIRLGIRTTVVITTAYLTRQVGWVIWMLVAFEGLRLATMSAFSVKQKLFTALTDTAPIKAQFAYFAPLGASKILYLANAYMGQFFISAVLGAPMLAVYTIGTYLYPIIHVFRSSIGDVIMTEIVSKRNTPPKEALGLWQRATVIYLAVMFPMAVILFYFADVIVRTLFTAAYAEAIPIFQIFVFFLVRECFDFSLPLRVVNRTGVFFKGQVLSIIINLVLLLALFEQFGILGPALAIVITRFLMAIYYVAYVMKYCEFSMAELLPWSDLAKVTTICMVCIPILFAGELLPMGPLIRAILSTGAYAAVFVGLLSKCGIPEINNFLSKVWVRIVPKATQR